MNPNETHDDDKPVGTLLSRREMLRLFGGAMGSVGAVALFGGGMVRLVGAQTATGTPAATSTLVPACVVRPALTEGPYYVANDLNRSDIRIEPSDGRIKEGALLKLNFRVFDVSGGTCTPLAGAIVDIWHCDAAGVYSGVSDPGFDTSDELWLRGYQITDDDGEAQFTTIYPGWYSGRTVHIHFKVRTAPEAEQGYEFTSQLFFDDAFTDEVYTQAPYNSRGRRNTLNSSDGIYQGSEGLLTLDVQEEADGYSATFGLGLDLNEPAPVASGPGASGAAGWPGNGPRSGGGNGPRGGG